MLLDTRIVINPINDNKILKTETCHGELSTLLNTGETLLFRSKLSNTDDIKFQDCNEEMHIKLANMIHSLPADTVDKVSIQVKDTLND